MYIPSNPHSFANPLQRLIVGSSIDSSAVDGFNPMNATMLQRDPKHHRRHNAYLNVRHSEKMAPLAQSS
jgi:hypothetical protein